MFSLRLPYHLINFERVALSESHFHLCVYIIINTLFIYQSTIYCLSIYILFILSINYTSINLSFNHQSIIFLSFIYHLFNNLSSIYHLSTNLSFIYQSIIYLSIYHLFINLSFIYQSIIYLTIYHLSNNLSFIYQSIIYLSIYYSSLIYMSFYQSIIHLFYLNVILSIYKTYLCIHRRRIRWHIHLNNKSFYNIDQNIVEYLKTRTKVVHKNVSQGCCCCSHSSHSEVEIDSG